MIASRLVTNRTIIHFNNSAVVSFYYALMSSYGNGLASCFYLRRFHRAADTLKYIYFIFGFTAGENSPRGTFFVRGYWVTVTVL